MRRASWDAPAAVESVPRAAHYWRKRLLAQSPAAFAIPWCDAGETTAHLSNAPRPALSWFDRAIAFLTTPFKRLGIQGWKETGCTCLATGAPFRDAQHSTDGFWTIDVALSALSIGSLAADLSAPRYLRLEIEPGTKAHDTCALTPVKQGMPVSFAGPLVIDTDADFLECHPDTEFSIER